MKHYRDECFESFLNFNLHFFQSITYNLKGKAIQSKYWSYTESLCKAENLIPQIYVRFQLIVQNVVSSQPCVRKLGISLVLLNFLGCICGW